jgi:energy-coupling factor transporter ATP-binding protein EcfA2
MAYIRSFIVEELAGRRLSAEINFNRDVNVFFGANGSGKTSLLRILHSALSGRSRQLRKIPFASAIVEIGDAMVNTPRMETPYHGDLTRQTVTETSESRQLVLSPELEGLQKSQRGDRKLWRSFTPGVTDQAFGLRNIYLPISRLYTSENRRLPRTDLEPVSESVLSEAALERLFTDMINFLWLRYTRNTSLEIQRAQSYGISEILADFLAPETEVSEPYEADVPEAYRRLHAFLGRQIGANRAAISEEAFSQRIQSDPRMRRVLKDITAVESEVERIGRPRSEFERILKQMISPEKTVELGDRDIHAFTDTDAIELGDLSSGEKQLLRICTDVLLADGAPVLIDEPELSMHIDWQRKMIPALRALAPDSQLIIATHSPEIMAPLKGNQIFEL